MLHVLLGGEQFVRGCGWWDVASFNTPKHSIILNVSWGQVTPFIDYLAKSSPIPLEFTLQPNLSYSTEVALGLPFKVKLCVKSCSLDAPTRLTPPESAALESMRF